MAAVTDAVLNGDGDVETILRQYGVARHEIEPFIGLIKGLDDVYQPVQPGAHFHARLKMDLLENTQAEMAYNLRRLPARVQFAAMGTFVWGLVTALWSRVTGDRDEKKETVHKEA